MGYTSRSWTPTTGILKVLHDATVKVKVSDTKYRRSPFIQGGLEIPVEVQMQRENSSENQQALSKYKTLIAENYMSQLKCLWKEIFASWIHSYFDNVMTKFMINNRTDV